MGRTAGPVLCPGAAIGGMAIACEYPNCRERAPLVVVIERDRSSVLVRICDAHAGRAQAIARQHDGIVYRIRPACPDT